jgi:hypothetical protein
MAVEAWEPTQAWDVHVPHRTPICESVNMKNVRLPPLTYRFRNADVHVDGKLSTFQYETVAYACQALHAGGAFLLGDATGVGKTRVLGAIAEELVGHRVLWLSVNTRLLRELNAEMRAIGVPEFALVSSGALSSTTHLFESYAGLLHGSKIDVLRTWLGEGASLLILDEAHMCRNDSATYRLVDALGTVATRVLYCSATAASSIGHLRYLSRLHIWGPGRSFSSCAELTAAMRQNSVSAMELLCLQLKREGLCVAREISFEGVELRHETVHLNPEEKKVYDYFARELCRVPTGNDRYQLFHMLLVSFKIDAAVNLAHAALREGMAPIISLQVTGEAAFLRGRGVLEEILCKHGIPLPPEWATTPANAIDVLIERLGGSSAVAELSGRTHRNEGGVMKRVPATKNEVEAFQSGRKRVAVLTRAGSTGISLHDEDGRRRVNIVLQLPWSSEEFLQQAGRCHRTNQKSAPIYVILTTSVPGENRLTQCVATRLETLGALTHGERRTHISCAAGGGARMDWSISTRRQAMFEVFVRQNPPNQPPPQALLSELPGRAPARDTLLLTWMSDVTRGDPALPWTAAQISAAVLAHHSELCYVSVTWSRKTHMRFPIEVRRSIEAVLMCSTRYETTHTVGALPASILDVILECVAADPWGGKADIGHVEQALSTIHVDLSTFVTAPSETAMNMLLRIPLKAQNVLRNLIAWNSRSRLPDPEIVPFNYFISRQGLSFEVVNIRPISILGNGIDRDGVAVAVVASAHPRADLPDTAVVVEDRLTGRLIGVEREGRNVRLWHPGEHPRTVTVRQWEHSSHAGRFRDLGVEARAGWLQLHRRRVGVDRARATRASRTYRFVVHDALGAWKASKRKVVLLPGAHGIGVWWD